MVHPSLLEKVFPVITENRVCLMGVLNVTPDSFWEPSRIVRPEAAITRADALVRDGADILDIGGESSRPGAQPISLQEELDRVIPVMEALASRFSVPLSIDTVKPEVAESALSAGASIVNDIRGMQDPAMRAAAARHQAHVIVMHMQGDPHTMQQNPSYGDVVQEIMGFFQSTTALCQKDGIEHIILDPGIGFGKTQEHNFQILKNLSSFLSLGFPVCVGTSRKSFLGKLLPEQPPLGPEERLEGTIASCVWAAAQGARILRVHDVKEVARATAFLEALWKS